MPYTNVKLFVVVDFLELIELHSSPRWFYFGHLYTSMNDWKKHSNVFFFWFWNCFDWPRWHLLVWNLVLAKYGQFSGNLWNVSNLWNFYSLDHNSSSPENFLLFMLLQLSEQYKTRKWQDFYDKDWFGNS